MLGGRQLIQTCTPDIIMEVAVDGLDPPAALSWLVDRGYRIFDLTNAGPRQLHGSLTALRNQRRSATRCYGEILASTRTDDELSDLTTHVAAVNWPPT